MRQKTAYEMRISDWSSDVCSSVLARRREILGQRRAHTDRLRSLSGEDKSPAHARFLGLAPALSVRSEAARDNGSQSRVKTEAVLRSTNRRATCRERECSYV